MSIVETTPLLSTGLVDNEGNLRQALDENEDIQSVVVEIEGLHEMFSELATLAVEQQPLISHIEDSCSNVVETLTNANDELESSIQIQKKSNKCKTISILILIFVIIILLVYISIVMS